MSFPGPKSPVSKYKNERSHDKSRTPYHRKSKRRLGRRLYKNRLACVDVTKNPQLNISNASQRILFESTETSDLGFLTKDNSFDTSSPASFINELISDEVNSQECTVVDDVAFALSAIVLASLTSVDALVSAKIDLIIKISKELKEKITNKDISVSPYDFHNCVFEEFETSYLIRVCNCLIGENVFENKFGHAGNYSSFTSSLRKFCRLSSFVIAMIGNKIIAIINANETETFYIFYDSTTIEYLSFNAMCNWIINNVCLKLLKRPLSYALYAIDIDKNIILEEEIVNAKQLFNAMESATPQNHSHPKRDCYLNENLCLSTSNSVCNNQLIQDKILKQNDDEVEMNGLLKPFLVIPGHYHQGSPDLFDEKSRGRQCTANAATAIAVSNLLPIPSWSKNTIDCILKIGNDLYLKSLSDFSANHLATFELFNRIDLSDSMYIAFSICNEFYGHLYETHEDPLLCLRDRLNMFASNETGAVLTVNDLSIAIMSQGSFYFVFDSHSRSPFGKIDVNGTACVFCYMNLDEVFNYIERTMHVSCGDNANTFTLSILSITDFNFSGITYNHISRILANIKSTFKAADECTIKQRTRFNSMELNQLHNEHHHAEDYQSEEILVNNMAVYDTDYNLLEEIGNDDQFNNINSLSDKIITPEISTDNPFQSTSNDQYISTNFIPYKKPKSYTSKPLLKDVHLKIDYDYVYKTSLHLMNEHKRSSRHDECRFNDFEYLGAEVYSILSTLVYECSFCHFRIKVDSEEENVNKLNSNDAVVLGCLKNGIGQYQLQSILASINMCSPDFKTYHQSEQYIGMWIIKAAFQCTKDAGADASKKAVAEGRICKDGIPYTDVVTDGSWSLRSYGTFFNSPAGMAVLIDFHTKKVIDYGIADKYCIICRINPGKEHICWRNFNNSLPSTSMERLIIKDIFINSLAKHNLRYTKMITDGDSSVHQAVVNTYSDDGIFVVNVSCCNHLLRRLTKNLQLIAKDDKCSYAASKIACEKIGWFKTHPNSGRAPNLRDLFQKAGRKAAIAIRAAGEHWRSVSNISNQSRLSGLTEDLNIIIQHTFGCHKDCTSYIKCDERQKESIDYIPLLKEAKLWFNVEDVFSNIVMHAIDILFNCTNNLAESLNSIIVSMTNAQRVNTWLLGSYAFRVQLAVIQFNTKTAMCQVLKTIGKEIPRLVLELENKRKKKVEENNIRAAIRGDKKNYKQNLCTEDCYYGSNVMKAPLSKEQFQSALENHLKRLKDLQEDRHALERRTILQSKCPEWIATRHICITASKFKNICCKRSDATRTTGAKSMVHAPPLKKPSPPIAHGTRWEQEAIEDFKDRMSINVKPCGIFLDESELGFGASPDGLIDQDAILEVKCPFSIRFMSPQQAILSRTKWATEHFVLPKIKRTSKSKQLVEISEDEFSEEAVDLTDFQDSTNSKDILRDNLSIVLKKNSYYYYQIQGALHITKRKLAYLHIWTYIHSLTIKMEYDPTFWNDEMYGKLFYFYWNFYVPELLDPNYHKKNKNQIEKENENSETLNICDKDDRKILEFLECSYWPARPSAAPTVRKNSK